MIKLLYFNSSFCRSFLFLYFVLTGFSSFAQTDKAAIVLKKFTQYNEQTVQEKVFVHTDRSAYVAGEIIWFKVYCADGKNNNLSQLSKVAYVEVLDKDLQPVLQGKIALKDGTGSGSFTIPFNLHSGNFILRAYTNWMKNFDPEFYFHQNLTIINTIRAEVPAATKAGNDYDVQFFPEGGYLVNELQSKVAFRATDKSGKGIEFTGSLVDENNDTVLHFQPARFGIGNFVFTPKKDGKYKAVLQIGDGSIVDTDLPKALIKGFVLSVLEEPQSNSVKLNIHTTTSDRSVLVVIHSNRRVKTAQTLNLNNGSADFKIDKSILDDGVSSITLLDQNNQPVCERLYFKRPHQQLLINAAANNQQFGTRRKVTIDVDTKDESANPELSDISMSVFLGDSSQVNNPGIYDYLWLSSDLKGVVESPEYYLGNNTGEVGEATDNLMLTHGWRRFKWQEMLSANKSSFKYLPEYEGHIVSAKIVNRYNDNPGSDVVGFLSVPGPLFQLYTAKSAADGSIYFNTRNFYGSKLIVAQPNKDVTDSFRLDIAGPFSESFSSIKPPPFSVSHNLSQGLLKRSINMQVQNEYAGERLNLFHAPPADTVNFYGKPQVKYMLDDYTRFPTMEEVLREYVREINVRKRRDNFTLTTVTKDDNGFPIVKEPIVLLDGVPQFDNGNKISHYDPLKVQKLEVVQDRYFYGPASFEGIASFSTYNGDLDGFRLDTVSTVMDYDGLQMKREFYSPVYETAQQSVSRLPDFRNLLFWSPDVRTDVSGKKQISFYTSDLTGRYAVVLQGISKQGKAGSKVMMIDVRK